MDRRYREELPFQKPFGEDLKKTGAYLYPEDNHQDYEGYQDAKSDIEQIDQGRQEASQCQCSRISHKNLGRIDIKPQKCQQTAQHHANQRRGYIPSGYERDDPHHAQND